MKDIYLHKIRKAFRERPALAGTMKSFSWLLTERVVTLAVAIFVNIPLARYLGPSDFGVWNYLLSAAALVAPLSTLGLSNIVTKEILDDLPKEGEVLGTVMWLRKGAAVICTALVAVFAYFYTFPDSRIKLLLVILVGATVIGNPAVLQNWFIAHYKLKLYTVTNVIRTVIFAVVRVFQVLTGASLTQFVLLAALEAGIAGIITMLAYKKARVEKIKWSWDTKRAKAIMGRSWPLTISSFTAAVNLKLDTILLAQMAGNAVAGTYSAAARLSEVWYFIPTLLMNAMFPQILAWKKSSEAQYNSRIQDLLDLFAFIGTIVAIFVSIFSHKIVNFLYGSGYSAAAIILSVHVWSGIFIFMRALLSKWLIAENLYTYSLVTQAAGAVANVLLNIFLIPRYGGVGAAISTVISYGFSSYFALAFHPKTLPMFKMMTAAIFWPRRLPSLIKRGVFARSF